MTTNRTTYEASVFAEGEADAWYERTREHLEPFQPERDLALRMLRFYGVRPKRVLGIGVANGARLAALRDETGAEVVGIELSQRAAHDARERYGLELLPEAVEDLSVEGTFDLVLAHFVLHWVSREGLDEAVKRMDARLAPGGLLLIGDFYPDRPKDVPYHHRTDIELFTHKRNYSKPFVALGNYTRIGFLSGPHDALEPGVGVDPDERFGLWLLEKHRGA